MFTSEENATIQKLCIARIDHNEKHLTQALQPSLQKAKKQLDDFYNDDRKVFEVCGKQFSKEEIIERMKKIVGEYEERVKYYEKTIEQCKSILYKLRRKQNE